MKSIDIVHQLASLRREGNCFAHYFFDVFLDGLCC